MNALVQAIQKDAALYGIAPRFLDKFAEFMQRVCNERLESLFVPQLLEENAMRKRHASSTYFGADNADPRKFYYQLCEVLEAGTVRSEVPVSEYVRYFSAKRGEADETDPDLVKAIDKVIIDWRQYMTTLYRDLTPLQKDEIVVIKREQFEDGMRRVTTGDVFTNIYVTKLSEAAQTKLRDRCPTLGGDQGIWFDAREYKRRTQDKTFTAPPKRGEIHSYASSVLTLLVRASVCVKLHKLKEDNWEAECDRFFMPLNEHISIARRLATADSVAKEASKLTSELRMLLIDPRTGMPGGDTEPMATNSRNPDQLFRAKETQPMYRHIRAVLATVFSALSERTKIDNATVKDALLNGDPDPITKLVDVEKGLRDKITASHWATNGVKTHWSDLQTQVKQTLDRAWFMDAVRKDRMDQFRRETTKNVVEWTRHMFRTETGGKVGGGIPESVELPLRVILSKLRILGSRDSSLNSVMEYIEAETDVLWDSWIHTFAYVSTLGLM